jgi:hypothetical protein
MSYDLYLWQGPQPVTAQQAMTICHHLARSHAGVVVPDAAVPAGYRESATNDFALGAAQLVPVGEGLFVANRIGQHGYRSAPGEPPVRYAAIGTAVAVTVYDLQP